MLSEKKKLTLSIDEQLIQAAKQYAEKHNTTVSKIVSALFEKIDKQAWDAESETPIFDRLVGVVRNDPAIEDYRDYLTEKYSG